MVWAGSVEEDFLEEEGLQMDSEKWGKEGLEKQMWGECQQLEQRGKGLEAGADPGLLNPRSQEREGL